MATSLAETTTVLEDQEESGSSKTCISTSLYYDDKEIFDLTLICNGEKFLVHRSVLFKSSRFLAELGKEDNEGMLIVHLPHLSVSTVHTLLKYIYKEASIPTNLSLSRYMELLKAARILQIKDAEDDIHQLLFKNKDDDFLVSLWDNHRNSHKEVTDMFHRCILDNLKELNTQNFFHKLNRQQYLDLLRIVQPCYRGIDVDDFAKATLQWLNADQHNRRHFVKELFPLQKWTENLPEMSFDRLVLKAFRNLSGNRTQRQKEANNKLKSWSTSALNFSRSQLKNRISQTTFDQMSTSSQSSVNFQVKDNSLYTERQDGSNIVGNSKNETEDHAEFKQPECLAASAGDKGLPQESGFELVCRKTFGKSKPKYCWNETKNLNSQYSLISPQLLECQRDIHNFRPAFCVFGFDFDGKFIMRICALPCSVWSNPIELNIPRRRDLTTAFYGQRIFMIGGTEETLRGSPKTFFYDMTHKIVYPYMKLRQGRLKAAAAILNGELYVVGGRDGLMQNRLRSVEKISVTTSDSKWHKVGLMNYAREFPGLVVANNRLYVIGGFANTCEYYDVCEDKWIYLKTLPDRYRLAGIVSILHRQAIYSFRKHNPNDVMILDLKTHLVHITLGSGEIPSTIASCAAICDEIFAVDEIGEIFNFVPAQNLWKNNHVRCTVNPFHCVQDASMIDETEMLGFYSDVRATSKPMVYIKTEAIY